MGTLYSIFYKIRRVFSVYNLYPPVLLVHHPMNSSSFRLSLATQYHLVALNRYHQNISCILQNPTFTQDYQSLTTSATTGDNQESTDVFIASPSINYQNFLFALVSIWIRSRVTKDYSSLRSSNPKYSRPRLGDPEGPRLRLSNPCIPSNGKGRKCLHTCGLPIAGIQGFEPRYSGPKPDVLPLDDIPIFTRQFVTWPIDYHNLPKKSAP